MKPLSYCVSITEVSDWEDHDNDEDETEPKDKGEKNAGL